MAQSISDLINTINIWKKGCEEMCYKYPYQYPHIEKRKKLIKKVERYLMALSKVPGSEETKNQVIRTLYDYLNPFNTIDKERKLDFLMAL